LQSFGRHGKIAKYNDIGGVFLMGENFLRENRMTGKVRSRKLKTGRFVFWLDSVSLFVFALLFFCTMSLIGCNGQKAKVVGTGQVKSTPAEQKKAALLKTLDRKFENPNAHLCLLA